jgi:hypothetical protein
MLEVARARIGYTFVGGAPHHPMRTMFLSKAVPIADMSEAALMNHVHEVDNDATILRAAVALALSKVSSSSVKPRVLLPGSLYSRFPGSEATSIRQKRFHFARPDALDNARAQLNRAAGFERILTGLQRAPGHCPVTSRDGGFAWRATAVHSRLTASDLRKPVSTRKGTSRPIKPDSFENAATSSS